MSAFHQFPFAVPSRVILRASVLCTALLALAPIARAQTYPVNLIETARTSPQEWSYTTTQPGDEWKNPGYDDAGWNKGMAGFGTAGTPGAVVATGWNSTDIWLRKTINLKGIADKSGLTALMHHDEDVEVYVNGTQIFGLTGYTINYETNYLDLASVNAFKDGDNVVALHCKQTIGGQYLDFGLVEYLGGVSVDLVQPSYLVGADWKYAIAYPNSDWAASDFNDADWPTGKAGFGAGGSMESSVKTAWSSDDIYLRTRFEAKDEFAHLILSIAHDDEAVVYLNGIQVATVGGYQTSGYLLDISTPGLKAIKTGTNVLAVTCHNLSGTPGFIDVSLMGLAKEAPVTLMPRVARTPRFFEWRPGHARLLVGTPGHRVDLSGRSEPLR